MSVAVIVLAVALAASIAAGIVAAVFARSAMRDELAATKLQLQQQAELQKAEQQRDAHKAEAALLADESARIRPQLAATQIDLNAAKAELRHMYSKEVLGATLEQLNAIITKRLAMRIDLPLSESGSSALEKP